MKNIFILTKKKTGERKGYLSVVALFADNKKEEIGVAITTIRTYKFTERDFENNYCYIAKIPCKTAKEIAAENAELKDSITGVSEAAETKFQIWKQGLGNPILDEQTLRNIYNAIDEKDK